MILSKSGGNINVTIAKLRKPENPSYFLIRYKGLALFIVPKNSVPDSSSGSQFMFPFPRRSPRHMNKPRYIVTYQGVRVKECRGAWPGAG